MKERARRLSLHLGLGLFGLVLPLAFHSRAEDAYLLPQLACLSLATLLLLIGRPLPRPGGAAAWLGLGFFALRLATALPDLKAGWALEQALFLLVFLWAANLREAALARRALVAIGLGVALASLYAVLQAWGWDPFFLGSQASGFGGRAHSSLGNPNFFGGWLALAIPLLPWGSGTFLALYALVLTQTRAAWIALAMGSLVLLPGARKARLAWVAGAVALALALTSFPGRFNPTQAKSVSRLASLASGAQADEGGRLFMAKAAWRIALAHPILGAGSFGGAFLEEQGRMLSEPGHAGQPFRFTPDAHQDWLQLAAESGFAAPLLFLSLLMLACRAAWRSGRHGVAAALVALGVNMLGHFPLAIAPSAALAWLLLGWGAGLDAPQERRPAPPLAFAFALALALLASAFFLRQWQASALLNRGMSVSLAGRAEEARPLLEKASILALRDQRALMRLGLDADGSGDFKRAQACFEEAMARFPQLPEAHANLGLVLAKQGRLEEGKRENQRALELNPRSIEALGNLGKIEYLLGHAPEAEALYLKGLALKPDWTLGRQNLAAIYVNSGRKAEAARLMKETK